MNDAPPGFLLGIVCCYVNLLAGTGLVLPRRWLLAMTESGWRAAGRRGVGSYGGGAEGRMAHRFAVILRPKAEESPGQSCVPRSGGSFVALLLRMTGGKAAGDSRIAPTVWSGKAAAWAGTVRPYDGGGVLHGTSFRCHSEAEGRRISRSELCLDPGDPSSLCSSG